MGRNGQRAAVGDSNTGKPVPNVGEQSAYRGRGIPDSGEHDARADDHGQGVLAVLPVESQRNGVFHHRPKRYHGCFSEGTVSGEEGNTNSY